MKTTLILICLLGSCFLCNVNAQSPADPAEAMRQRITAKVDGVKEGVQKWAASGRDPSAVVQTLQGTIKPLLEAGKANEAEAALDHLLEQLKSDVKAPESRSLAGNKSLGNKIRTEAADHFSVWISKMDGSERRLILSDPKRQITHTRVSPDLKWVVYTSYNDPGADGFAKEGGNYSNTEIDLFKLGDAEFKTIAGPVPGEVNANASFSPDGKRIIFVSTRSGKGSYLYWYDIAKGTTSQVPTPPALHRLSDPHEAGNKIVFPSRPEPGGGLQGIWMMNRDGSECRQITFPKEASGAPAERFGQGDYDPRLSPDGSRFSVLRNVGGAFHVVLVEAASGKETDLTQPLFPERQQTAEGVAAWSSDGALLVFRHIALPREGPQGVGIYIMEPDGTRRRKIPMAKGEFPNVQPEFFPEGSGPEARVIYQTEKNPRF
jgi:dipeptidyl aminopeptidase/acylaminoacyl peptidase